MQFNVTFQNVRLFSPVYLIFGMSTVTLYEERWNAFE
jgi:hypothetical protein